MKLFKEGRNPYIAAIVLLLAFYLNFFIGNYVWHGVVDLNIFSHGNLKGILVAFALVPVYFVARLAWHRVRKNLSAGKGK